jgi:hypothetical protein
MRGLIYIEDFSRKPTMVLLKVLAGPEISKS